MQTTLSNDSSCTDPATGRRLGGRCPRLADPVHGSWYFTVQAPTTGGRRSRLRKGGFSGSRQAIAARDRVLAASTVGAAGQGWTVAGWLRRWLATLPLQVRPSTAAGYRAHAEEHLIPHLGRHTLAGLRVGHLEAMTTAACRPTVAGHIATNTRRPESTP